MRTINFIKSTLVATFALALTLGFAACSDNDNKGTEPTNPEVKLLPTKMTEVYKVQGIEYMDIYTLEYNAKNQLVKVTENEERELIPTVRTYEYAADGRISAYKKKYPTNTKTYTYLYDDTKGTVTLFFNDREENVLNIDKDGLNTGKETSENGHTDKTTYEYDKYKNLTKFIDFEEYNEGGVAKIGQEVLTFTFGTVYSPYLNAAGLTAWFLFDEEYTVPMNTITGAHMPTQRKSISTKTTVVGGVKEVEDTEISTITILKKQDNYPTEIKVDYKETDIDGKEISSSTTTITIEYKEAI